MIGDVIGDGGGGGGVSLFVSRKTLPGFEMLGRVSLLSASAVPNRKNPDGFRAVAAGKFHLQDGTKKVKACLARYPTIIRSAQKTIVVNSRGNLPKLPFSNFSLQFKLFESLTHATD